MVLAGVFARSISRNYRRVFLRFDRQIVFHSPRIQAIRKGFGMTIFQCGWPPPKLWPNARTKHRHTTKERNAQKSEWFVEAKATRAKGRTIAIVFRPPCARRRDLDNMLAACKSGLDGLSLAMGIDDSEFTITISRGYPDRPNGSVSVGVSP